MRPLLLGLSAIVFGLWAASATAEDPWYRPYGYSHRPYGYGGEYYAAGYSPVEGYQRGLADVIRARGEAAESYSHAAINREIARSKYLDNKLKWTDIYWKRKRLGEAELAKNYDRMRARRDTYLAANRDRQPEVLAPSQLDLHSGEIEWPEPLQGPAYAELRKQIEEELKLQADTGTNSNAGKIRVHARQMQNILKDHIREMDSNEYIAARKFLDRLVNQMVLTQTT